MEFLLIFISAIFVNNIVLSQFLGICPFLGVSKKVETALGMSAAVAFVMTLATIVTYVLQKFVLDAFGLAYLQTIAFILVIAALVQMVEIVMKKVSPALYQAVSSCLLSLPTVLCWVWQSLLSRKTSPCCKAWYMPSLLQLALVWHSSCLRAYVNSWSWSMCPKV